MLEMKKLYSLNLIDKWNDIYTLDEHFKAHSFKLYENRGLLKNRNVKKLDKKKYTKYY